MAKEQKKTGVALGVGVAAAAAVAAAGAYWFYGSDHASQHRKQVKSWMLKARAEAMDAVEKMGDIDKKKYLAIVQDIISKYSKTAGATVGELAHMKKDLIATWSHMDAARTSGTKVLKGVKKSAKKVAKKTSKK
jgi:NAD(P)-dependent dehydrogenase (short-subunit alcohol dehydrogenase family)